MFLDDGTTWSNVSPVPYLGGPLPGTPLEILRGGDMVRNLEGVIEYSRIDAGSGRDYRLQPTQQPTFKNMNKRDETPRYVGGDLKVATLNVLNYFTTLDGSGKICGPDGHKDYCRGADSASEFERQEIKIVKALAGLDADIVGLVELENNQAATPAGDGVDPVLEQLVAALNSELGAPAYDFIDAGVMGTDVIKVALIYKVDTMTPVGGPAVLDSSVDPTFLDEYNRPVLAQTFADENGEKFTVAVNHLKSKGSDCDDVGDPIDPNGQGNCNLTRLAAVEAELNWLAGDPTGSLDPDFMIVGDLNSYAKEDPVRAITDAGYIDLIDKYENLGAYTYTFDGLLGYLDHALVSRSMKSQVQRATVWHINTDEPAVTDYDQNYNPDGYFTPDPFRASDHDPVLVGLRLR